MSSSDRTPTGARLVIVADDYGYAAPYDEGIMEAVRAQAVDAVSAMVMRGGDAAALLSAAGEADVDVGLHLEPLTQSPLARQIAAFGEAFGRAPAYIDGHHHCHAEAKVADEIAAIAAVHAIPVRSVDATHRELLRRAGVRTADRLVGRMSENEPVIPSELEAALSGAAPEGATEWMVHPGRAGGPSSYDAGRERDLAELLRLGDRASWRAFGVLRTPPSLAGLR